MARVVCQSTGGGQNQRDPNAGFQHAGDNRKSSARSTGAKCFRHAGRCQPGPSRKPKASRRRAAHAHGRRGRNGDGHHPQIRREARRVAGGESGREPEPDSPRPGPEPAVTVMGPHASASHISFHHGILDRDERAVVARRIRFARHRSFRAGGFGVAENFDRAGRLVIDRLSRRTKNRLLPIFHECRTSHGRAR